MSLIKKLFIGAIPIAVGFLSSLFCDFKIYKEIVKPTLSPPSFLFPIVWTILYLLMGYVLVRLIEDKNKDNLLLFGIQLFLNFIWSIIFFKFKLFLESFIVIIFLDIIVFYLIIKLWNIDRKSSYFLIPYLLWIIFASYLNWMIFLLN